MTTLPYEEEQIRLRESIIVSMDHLIDDPADPESCVLDPELTQWLYDRGVADDQASASWWIDRRHKPQCVRIWLADIELRMLFKLTWGGL